VEGVVGEEDKGSGLGWAAVASPQARFKDFSYLFCFLFIQILFCN
jgi:hypothetical protein